MKLLQNGGTGVSPVKFGVPPNFVCCFHDFLVYANQNPFSTANGFGRDARNDRPEACATKYF
jgi:hypothetical protein